MVVSYDIKWGDSVHGGVGTYSTSVVLDISIPVTDITDVWIYSGVGVDIQLYTVETLL